MDKDQKLFSQDDILRTWQDVKALSTLEYRSDDSTMVKISKFERALATSDVKYIEALLAEHPDWASPNRLEAAIRGERWAVMRLLFLAASPECRTEALTAVLATQRPELLQLFLAGGAEVEAGHLRWCCNPEQAVILLDAGVVPDAELTHNLLTMQEISWYGTNRATLAHRLLHGRTPSTTQQQEYLETAITCRDPGYGRYLLAWGVTPTVEHVQKAIVVENVPLIRELLRYLPGRAERQRARSTTAYSSAGRARRRQGHRLWLAIGHASSPVRVTCVRLFLEVGYDLWGLLDATPYPYPFLDGQHLRHLTARTGRLVHDIRHSLAVVLAPDLVRYLTQACAPTL